MQFFFNRCFSYLNLKGLFFNSKLLVQTQYLVKKSNFLSNLYGTLSSNCIILIILNTEFRDYKIQFCERTFTAKNLSQLMILQNSFDNLIDISSVFYLPFWQLLTFRSFHRIILWPKLLSRLTQWITTRNFEFKDFFLSLDMSEWKKETFFY